MHSTISEVENWDQFSSCWREFDHAAHYCHLPPRLCGQYAQQLLSWTDGRGQIYWPDYSGETRLSYHQYMRISDHLTSGLYYKHMTIINYASNVIKKLGASLTDDASHHLQLSCVYSTRVYSTGHRSLNQGKLNAQCCFYDVFL
jgi:hypothetical protein